MADLSLRGVGKVFGGSVEVLRDLDLDIADGEFMVFVGPSGCGKSTLLRLIAGLDTPTRGEIRIGGEPVDSLAPSERGVAMVFQSYALYPHMTVAQNLGFALRMDRRPAAEIAARVGRAAEILQLSALLDRLPKALSGGQRQRVAIGRAIVREPRVFLFDEPLSNLDAALRVQMRLELARLHQELGTTMVYVTHDQVEAMTLGDRIALFNGGRLEQVGPPLELYERPRTRFVAGFLGQPQMNFLPMAHVGAAARMAWLGGLEAVGPDGVLGVRPDHLELVAPEQGLAGRLERLEHVGDAALAWIRLGAGGSMVAVRLLPGGDLPQAAAPVGLRPLPGRVLAFDAAGLARPLVRTDATPSREAAATQSA
ncbi:MAG: ABC transporter ATP-binding protein [Betaproteobacteria bacterium]